MSDPTKKYFCILNFEKKNQQVCCKSIKSLKKQTQHGFPILKNAQNKLNTTYIYCMYVCVCVYKKICNNYLFNYLTTSLHFYI